MSPRQGLQLILFVGLTVFFVARIVEGTQVVAMAVGLAACLVGGISLLRYYLQGGKPLDRGGQPFWRRP